MSARSLFLKARNGLSVGRGAGAPPRLPRIKRFLPKTLLGRSLTIILTPLVLLQVISTWVFYDRHYDTTTKRLAQGLAGDLATVIAVMIHNPDTETQERIFRLAGRSMRLQLTFEENARLAVVAPRRSINVFTSVLDAKLDKALREYVGRPFQIDTHSRADEVEIQVQLAEGVLRALVPRSRLFSSTTYIFIMWMIGSSIVLFGVAIIFMRNQVRPIVNLARAADSFGKGRDVANFKPEGAAEVRLAAAAFLMMRNRIKRQITQRTEILAGVSHDLRTPLTRMKLELAMLGEKPEVENLEADVSEMERMIEGYLAFARGEGTEQPQPADLSALLREVVTDLGRAGGRGGKAIDLHIEETITLPLRREAMRRCLTNLIANARRYGEAVSVRLGLRQGAAEVIVDDDGPGIPPEAREDVFKPFFRLEQSRNPETGGVGLGLTIARDVARNHGGELTLEDAPSGGLRARLRLPV